MSDRIPGSSQWNPIKHRDWEIWLAAEGPYAFVYAHKDFDSADDRTDPRHGYAHTVDEAKRHIDEFESENA